MRKLSIVLTLSFLAVACSGEKSGDSSSGKVVAKSQIDYGEIYTKVKAAKNSDDFLNLVMDCGKLEIEAATNGNSKLAEDPEYKKHCRIAPEVARAKLTIAESKPDKMSAMCISSSMGLEELIEKGESVAELKPLLADVNKACGL